MPEEEGERERVVKKNRTQKTVIFVSINPAPVSHIFYPLETTCSFCLSAGVTAPRRSVCMSAAKVQLECTTIDTSEPQIQKHVHIMEHMVITTINLSGHHTYSHAHTHTHVLQSHIEAHIFMLTRVRTHTHKQRQRQHHKCSLLTHLPGDTCVSACSHCCPLGCAVLHTVLPA